jgi:predicted enzyme related to lactoylglutathione lyase
MGLALNIGSEDPKRLADYYTKLLGAPAMEGGGYSSWEIDGSLITVGPHDEVNGKNAHPGRLVWSILTSDAKGDFARYRAAGATVVRELYEDADAPQFSIATFADPDDNYFQLVEHRK